MAEPLPEPEPDLDVPACTCGVDARRFHARSCAVVVTPSRVAGTPPYVTAEQPIPVIAAVNGQRWPGEVNSWRGERVYVRWRTGAGNHLGWLPADGVERT